MRIDIDGMDIETETENFCVEELEYNKNQEELIRNIKGVGKILEMIIKQTNTWHTEIALMQLNTALELAVQSVTSNFIKSEP